jgi:cobalt-zinc-cadmium resistance protein CzcA
MFKPMAQTVAFALLGAFILSLTYIPMMSAFFLSKKINSKTTDISSAANNKYFIHNYNYTKTLLFKEGLIQ